MTLLAGNLRSRKSKSSELPQSFSPVCLPDSCTTLQGLLVLRSYYSSVLVKAKLERSIGRLLGPRRFEVLKLVITFHVGLGMLFRNRDSLTVS